MTKTNILIISFQLPFPLRSGGSIAQYFFLKEMTEKYDVTFCTLAQNRFQKKNIDGLSLALPKLNLKVLDLTPTSEKKQNYFKKLLLRVNTKISHILKPENNVLDPYVDFNLNKINEPFILFVKKLFESATYDIIQLEFFETLTLLPLLPHHSKKIVVHHEIRAKRNAFLNPVNSYSNYLNKVLKLNENSLLHLADTVVVFNTKDKEFLKSVDTLVTISPFGIPDELILKQKASITFNKLLFIGSENHLPNKEGLSWFLDTIYIPNISSIELPIIITGSWSPQFVSKYRHEKKIQFACFVESLAVLYNKAIMITPILSGSGIRTKILEAFSNFIPVISTRFASEGLCDKKITIDHILHFENETEFLEIIKTALNNSKLLSDTANKGNDYFNEHFEQKDLLHKRFSIYSSD